MIVSLSTGSVQKVSASILEQVHFIEKEFSGEIDGIEICFIQKEDFDKFEFDQKAIDFLNRLEFNTLHAPTREIDYGNNKETEDSFRKISEMTKIVNMNYVTFHPNHVSDFSVLPIKEFKVCI